MMPTLSSTRPIGRVGSCNSQEALLAYRLFAYSHSTLLCRACYRIMNARISTARIMASETLEKRVTAVEKELARLKARLAKADGPADAPRWEKIFGSFARSEGFEEAVRLGREYR